MFAGFGSWVARFRWPVLIVALVAVVSAGVWGLGVFGQLSEGGYNDPNSESSHAAEAVKRAFGAQGGDVVAIYTPTGGKIDDAALSRRISDRLAALPTSAVKSSTSYWQQKSPQYAAEDRSSAVAVINLAGADDSAKMDSYRQIDDEFAVDGATVQLAGATPLGDASARLSTADLASAEIISLPIVLILLLFIFGSLVAAALPVLVGGAAVLGSLGVLHAVASAHDVNSFAVNVASLLGLGMAIDYGLFIVGRFREEQAEGRTPAEAVQRTLATAGRTVLFSATLLMIALGGLLLFPQGFLKSLAYGGLAAVALAAILSLTLLPAMLAVLGRRVDMLPVRLPRFSSRPAGTAWARLAGFVLRRPILIALPILAGLLVLAAPIGGVHFGESDERVLPAGEKSRQAIEVLKASYPQFADDGVQIVLSGGRDTGLFAGAARSVPGVASITPAQRAGTVTVLTATLDSTDPFSTSARDTVDAVRALPVPAGATLLVGGTTARNIDSIDATAAKLPLMVGLLVGATLVLMFLAFGSILLPIKAVLMSALSLSATFGILVWIFQDGHGSGQLAITPAPLEVGIVVLMAAVVFGLSTDYEVFLLSRMVEARTRGASTAEAVTTGLARTGRVISAAALLLIVVTGAFALSSVTTMRFVGVGMIVALLLDATVVRMLLVPAVLSLLGNAAWWAPGPLRRLQARAGLAEYAGEELFPAVSVGKHAAPDDTQVLFYGRPLALPGGAPATVSGTDVWAHQPALAAAVAPLALPAGTAETSAAGAAEITAVFPAIAEETDQLQTIQAPDAVAAVPGGDAVVPDGDAAVPGGDAAVPDGTADRVAGTPTQVDEVVVAAGAPEVSAGEAAVGDDPIGTNESVTGGAVEPSGAGGAVDEAEPPFAAEPVVATASAVATEPAVTPERVDMAGPAGTPRQNVSDAPGDATDPAIVTTSSGVAEPAGTSGPIDAAGSVTTGVLPGAQTPVELPSVPGQAGAFAAASPSPEPVTDTDLAPTADAPTNTWFEPDTGFDMVPLGSRLGLPPTPPVTPARQYTDWTAHSDDDFFFAPESKSYAEPLPPAVPAHEPPATRVDEPSPVPVDAAEPVPAPRPTVPAPRQTVAAEPVTDDEPADAAQPTAAGTATAPVEGTEPETDDRFVTFSYADERRARPVGEVSPPAREPAWSPTEAWSAADIGATAPATDAEPADAPDDRYVMPWAPPVTPGRPATPRRPATLADQEPGRRPAEPGRAAESGRPTAPAQPADTRPTDLSSYTEAYRPTRHPAQPPRPAAFDTPAPPAEPQRPHRTTDVARPYVATDVARPYVGTDVARPYVGNQDVPAGPWRPADRDRRAEGRRPADLSQMPGGLRPDEVDQVPDGQSRADVEHLPGPRRPTDLSRVLGGRRPPGRSGPQQPADLEQYSPATGDRTPSRRPADLGQLDAADRPFPPQPGPARSHPGQNHPGRRGAPGTGGRPGTLDAAGRPIGAGEDGYPARPAHLGDQTPRPRRPADLSEPAPTRRPADLGDAQGRRPVSLADQTRPATLADQDRPAQPGTHPAADPARPGAPDPSGPTRDLSAYSDHDGPRRR